MTAMPATDARAFRRTLGCFPTGVAIVTTQDTAGAPVGLAVSSFNAVSITPPLILWSLALTSANLPVFRQSDGFVINILAAEQADLLRVFSTPVDDRFANIGWAPGQSGYPVLDDAAAVIECRTYARYDGGDHEIILGEVTSHQATERTPLVYGKGQLGPLILDPEL